MKKTKKSKKGKRKEKEEKNNDTRKVGCREILTKVVVTNFVASL